MNLISTLRSLDRLPPLGPGIASCAATDEVEKLLIQFVPEQKHSGNIAAGLFLYFDCLEESHNLSQELRDQDGSYWHGLMHRREPDAFNAKYWFRKVGNHAIFEPMMSFWNQVASESKAKVSPVKSFDPAYFTDLCEEARVKPGSTLEEFCRIIQREEYLMLLESETR